MKDHYMDLSHHPDKKKNNINKGANKYFIDS